MITVIMKLTLIKLENISSSQINDVNPENRNYSGSRKNEMAQLSIHDILLRPSVNFNNVENMTLSFDSNLSQNGLKFLKM